jgi:8-oxo-dGTP pyrophosphatase MutT (NUDIX family)
LPYRLTKARSVELLLVTSRESKRWIIPKGWPIEGLAPSEAAAQEAYEEAGVRGTVARKAVGAYSYKKGNGRRGRTVACKVSVFPLLVRRRYAEWPEHRQRRARWVSIRKALSLVSDDGLRTLISVFQTRAISRRARA